MGAIRGYTSEIVDVFSSPEKMEQVNGYLYVFLLIYVYMYVLTYIDPFTAIVFILIYWYTYTYASIYT
jgi:hypothetical protein